MNSSKVEFIFLSEPDMIEAGVLNMTQCFSTMEEVFELLSTGDYLMGGPNENDHGLMLWFPKEKRFPNMPIAGPDRRFMSMIAYLGGRFNVCADKWYGSNIENREKGLPRSVLMVTLNDSDTGKPLAYMSGNLISAMRTGAVPGVAAKYLANKESKIASIFGAGVISRACLKAIVVGKPDLEEIRVYDLFYEKSQQFAEEMSRELGVKVIPTKSIKETVENSDIISIATSGHSKVKLEKEWIKPGCLIELTGTADLDDEFYINNKIVADNWNMHLAWLEDARNHPHGFESIREWAPTGQLLELINSEKINGETVESLGDVITQNKTIRENESDIIIFVTGGMPVYDTAWGYEIYRNALKKGIGQKLTLWDSPHWV